MVISQANNLPVANSGSTTVGSGANLTGTRRQAGAQGLDPKASVAGQQENAAEVAVTSQDDPAAAEQRRLQALARREEERENVIAVSDDGDTLQVEGENADIVDEAIGEVNALGSQAPQQAEQERDQARQIAAPELTVPAEPPVEPPEPPEGAQATLQEQIEGAPAEGAAAVLEEQIRTPELETTAEQLAEKDASREDNVQAPSTYAGISDMTLEQMYRNGVISRYDYETEVEARKDAKQQLMQDNERVSQELGEISARERSDEQRSEAIRTATSDRTANQDFAVSAGERLDAMERVNQNNNIRQEENRRREEDNNRVWRLEQSLA